MEGQGSSSIVTNNTAVEDQADFVNRLPPGYRFHPTDDEIINYYLTEKIANPSFVARAIAEVDLNKCEPWDLPEKAKMGEKEWYFFCQRDRKYPTGMRTNRATEAGYWKATGKDREICHDRGHGNGLGSGVNIGMKKTLVFYQGRAPKGTKTNWVMHEYRLDAKSSHHFSPHNRNHPKKHEEWVVCRIFYKRALITKSSYLTSNQDEDDHKIHFNDGMVDFSALPPLDSIGNGIPNMFSNTGFTCIESPPPLTMDHVIFNQHRLVQYQLPITYDPLFQNTHDSSGLTMQLDQLPALRSNLTYTSDINVKKESTPWYDNITYDEDSSIVGGTISDSELDNLWN